MSAMWAVFCLFVVASFAAAPPPLPQQFEADVSITAAGASGLPGHLWFDWTNHGAHVQVPLIADLVATPNAAQSITSFYGVVSGACQEAGSLSWSQIPATFQIPANATFVGTQTINGIATQGWNYTSPGSNFVPAVAIFLSQADHSLVRLSGKVIAPGSNLPVPFVFDFSNTKVGPVDPSNYAKPASCP